MSRNKKIVISAINFFEGGPLSILNDCLLYLNYCNLIENFQIIALVHKKSLFNQALLSNIEFHEFPKSRRSYIHRIYYEYFYFKKVAKKLNPILWLSLHDVTPNVGDTPQAVYCHNPSIFNTLSLSDLFIQPKQLFFKLFYKYLYSLNIQKNTKVIVQQIWIGDEFKKYFRLSSDKIIFAPPQVPLIPLSNYIRKKTYNNIKIFLYPTFPRPVKNVEVICESVLLLKERGITNFRVIITLDGTENIYSKNIYKKYKHLNNIEFIGLQTRENIYELYAISDCLIFPSKLETWGLPLSEYKQFDKPILVSNLPYAIETIGSYEKACFFNPYIESELAYHMSKLIINNKLDYSSHGIIHSDSTIVESWESLFNILLC